MAEINYAVRNEALRLQRDVTPTAYQKGYEDYRYCRVYLNPFVLGSEDFWDYDRGNADARTTEQDEKI